MDTGIRDCNRQRGVALIMALMFLVIITLIALATMRGSTLELKMAGNEQMRVEAIQSAQSAIDAVTKIENLRVGPDNPTVCFNRDSNDPDYANCDEHKTDLATTEYTNNQVEVRQDYVGPITCRTCGTSAKSFQGAQFSIWSEYGDPTHGGRAEITQGLLMPVPQ